MNLKKTVGKITVILSLIVLLIKVFLQMQTSDLIIGYGDLIMMLSAQFLYQNTSLESRIEDMIITFGTVLLYIGGLILSLQMIL